MEEVKNDDGEKDRIQTLQQSRNNNNDNTADVEEFSSQFDSDLKITDAFLPTTKNNTTTTATTTATKRTTLICDSWYGFPIQKRPRQERILAVSKQIFNYIIWNDDYLLQMKRKETKQQQQQRQSQSQRQSQRQSIGATTTAAVNGKHANIYNNNNKMKPNHDQSKISRMIAVKAVVYVIGKRDDVKAIQNRVNQLLLTISSSTSSTTNNEEEQTFYKTDCQYLPGVTLEELYKKIFMTNSPLTTETTITAAPTTTTFEKKFVYLSPDAVNTLDPLDSPPAIFVVGMLVDRKVQHNRSKSRADSIQNTNSSNNESPSQNHNQQNNDNHGSDTPTSKESLRYFHCAQLPLDTLNVQDLNSNEPLNIDTVLEMVQRWWYNFSLADDSVRTIDDDDDDKKDRREEKQGINHFKDAAARALLTHRNRHPKRTIHGNNSTKTI